MGIFVEGRVNAGGFARLVRKAVLHGGSVLQLEITRAGRDHTITIRSQKRLLMVANVFKARS